MTPETDNKAIRRYVRMANATLTVVFLLILIGASVRSSGAGLGCPDWPKCFGQWIPPVHESQLPDNYQEVYKDQGYDNQSFNAVHTWTEYVNRLFGVLTGFFIIGTFIASFPFYYKSPAVFRYSLAALVLVIIQGWIGGQVVASQLEAYMVSIHFLMAFSILAMLLLGLNRCKKINQADRQKTSASAALIMPLLAVVMLATLAQTFLGTLVRAEVSQAASSGYDRSMWTTMAGSLFEYHQHLTILIATLNGWLIYKIYKLYPGSGWMKTANGFIFFSLLLQTLTGLLLHYFSFPAYAQALHVLFATTLFAGHFMVASEWINEAKDILPLNNLKYQNLEHARS